MHCTGSELSLWPGSRWALCAVCSAGSACGLWAMEIWCRRPNSGNGQVGTHTAMTDEANIFIIIRQAALTISHQLLCVIIVTWWSYNVSLWSTSYNMCQNKGGNLTFFLICYTFYTDFHWDRLIRLTHPPCDNIVSGSSAALAEDLVASVQFCVPCCLNRAWMEGPTRTKY